MKAQSTTLPDVTTTPEVWYEVDAAGQIVGRVAARIAQLVRGKLNPDFTPHLNPKIHVVIVNADKVVFTGKKLTDKFYRHHTGWMTGLKSTSAGKMLKDKPEEVLRQAIHGMLPKNRLGSVLNKNIRIYAGAEHPHQAQNPKPLVVKTRQPRPRL